MRCGWSWTDVLLGDFRNRGCARAAIKPDYALYLRCKPKTFGIDCDHACFVWEREKQFAVVGIEKAHVFGGHDQQTGRVGKIQLARRQAGDPCQLKPSARVP